MDDECYDILKELRLSKAVLVRMKDFEDPELLASKADKSVKEYNAMCKPSLVLYVLNKTNAPIVTFLDGDLYFFGDPTAHYADMKDASILLTPHRFPPGTSAQEKTGAFNAGWCAFRNDANGRAALQWWRERCNEWCYVRHENGRYADQGYLTEFPVRFNGVKSATSKGLNVAYWNVFRYDIFKKNGVLLGRDKETNERFPIIFFHFSAYAPFRFGTIMTYGYNVRYLPLAVTGLIFQPYAHALGHALHLVRRVAPSFAKGYATGPLVPLIRRRAHQALLATAHALLDPWRERRRKT